MRKKFWDTLSAQEKQIIGDAAAAAGKYQRQVAREAAGSLLERLKKSSMEVTELPDAEVVKLRATACAL
ncbi:MAG: TRAP-type C4-dicarboxylate transport system substrate-binding protein [Rhodoferax sp.]|jgi:TRAP-type C4-dicarboxylate transport system substrate-binding protein